MTDKLVSRAVFLDTSEFVRRKFNYTDKELGSLRDLCQEGILRLVLPEVTRRELEVKLGEQLDGAVTALKKVRQDGAVLQSLDEDWLRGALFQRPDKEELLASLKERLHGFLGKAKYEEVSTKELPAGPVLDRYFENRPPFGSGAKKHEFPDAFALAALESWCETTGEKAYVVSGDGDLKGACEESPSLVHAAKLAEVLELALKDKGVRTELAHAAFGKAREAVQEAIGKTWQEWEVLSLDEVGAEVSNVKVIALDLGPETVVQQTEERADYSLYAEISFEADAEYYDPGYFIWDDEEREAIYLEKVHHRIERTMEVPLDVTVRFDPQDLGSGTVEEVVVNHNDVLILDTYDKGTH